MPPDEGFGPWVPDFAHDMTHVPYSEENVKYCHGKKLLLDLQRHRLKSKSKLINLKTENKTYIVSAILSFAFCLRKLKGIVL